MEQFVAVVLLHELLELHVPVPAVRASDYGPFGDVHRREQAGGVVSVVVVGVALEHPPPVCGILEVARLVFWYLDQRRLPRDIGWSKVGTYSGCGGTTARMPHIPTSSATVPSRSA